MMAVWLFAEVEELPLVHPIDAHRVVELPFALKIIGLRSSAILPVIWKQVYEMQRQKAMRMAMRQEVERERVDH